MVGKIGFENIGILLLVGVLVIIIFNTIQLQELKSDKRDLINKKVNLGGNKNLDNVITGVKSSQDIDVIPHGIPKIYGKELELSYDDVSPNNQQNADITIKKLGSLDQQIKLSDDENKRYISIVSQISCEYCCGVDSIILSDGKPACGCAHSFAMRGLAKYLLKNHWKEYTDDQILDELGKWKTLFFPSQITKKAIMLKEKGIELNYINLASNKYRGIENGN